MLREPEDVDVPRVLVVTAQPPAVEGGAAGRCMVALLRGLVAHGCDVTAIAPVAPFHPPGSPPADLDVRLVPVPDRRGGGAGDRLRRLRSPLDDLARGPFAAAVRTAAAEADVVHLDQVETACLAPYAGDRPVALHLHYRARLDAPMGPPWRASFRHRLEFARAEALGIRRVRHVIASAGDVAASLRAAGAGSVTQIALPLDPADYPVARHDGGPVAGILGTAAWAPTAAAMRRLAGDVWPLVRRQLPEARLVIAGRGTGALEAELSGGGVEVAGEVDAAGEFLAGLGVLAYPPTRGSGAKVKVLEALACGVPAVVTDAGAQGIDPTAGLVVATDPVELAARIAELLGDPGRRREQGAAGRAAIAARHAPLPATRPLVELYRRMLT